MAYRDIEIYIVKPKGATNLVTNPSFETGTTGYTTVGASTSIARTAAQGYQRRGLYGLDITPTSGAESGVYFGTVALTSGTQYTFSCDVRDVVGQTFNLYIRAADGSPTSASTTWTGDGYWKRKSVTWTCTSTENYRLYLTRSSVASASHFYTDGWQLETGAESTYLDGDMRGYIRDRKDYWWNGTPHASTSTRSSATRHGGTLFRLRDYCAILSIMGLGMAIVENNASPTSSNGSYYQNTRVMERQLDVAVAYYTQSGGFSTLAANRAAVVSAIQPDNVPAYEPLRLLIQAEDSTGAPASDMVVVDCLYEAGLEGNIDSRGQILDQAVITFRAFDPYIKLDGQEAASLAISTSIGNTAYILYRTASGQWTSAGVCNGAVRALVEDQAGRVWAAGAFTSIGGVAANRVAYWDGTAWNAASSGLAAEIYALAVAPNGNIYAGGAANIVGTSAVAVWNGSSWAAPAASNNPGATVYALAFDGSGNLYIGGSFASAGGGTVNGICKWNGSSYSALGSGFASGTVRSIVCRGSYVYAAGDGTYVGVQRWNGSTWTNLNCPIEDYIYSLAFDYKGRLYAAGVSTPGASVIGIYDVWNGRAWESGGVLSGYSSTEAMRKVIVLPPGNNIVFLGSIIRFGVPTSMPSAADLIRLRGNTYYYQDIDLNIGSGEYISDGLLTKSGQWWLGGTWTNSTASACAGITPITITGAIAYPVIRITGPGYPVVLQNYTTGKSISFDRLYLSAGETVTLDLRRGRIAFTSDWRGNILRHLKTGSDMDLALINGTNYIGLQMTATTGASGALMSWSPAYHVFDTVVR